MAVVDISLLELWTFQIDFLISTKNLKLSVKNSNRIQTLCKSHKNILPRITQRAHGVVGYHARLALIIKFARGVGFNSQCVHIILVFTFFPSDKK